MDEAGQQLTAAARYGATVFVQFVSEPDCTPAVVRRLCESLQGPCQGVGDLNEPNFAMRPEQYVAFLRKVTPQIRASTRQPR
jgi:hypothetical protein